MSDFFDRISRAGLVLAIIGAALLAVSLGDTIISLKPARSFDSVLEEGASAGDHVAGRVPYLLDSFATMETWTENRSTNSRTPAKTSARYYVLPGGDAFLGLTVRSTNFAAAKQLAEQTYDYLTGGTPPEANLELDVRVVKMEDEVAQLLREELRDYYGLSDGEIDSMGPLLMAEPRAFGTIRAFCAAGAALFLLGVVWLALYWRKTGPRVRKTQESFDPELN